MSDLVFIKKFILPINLLQEEGSFNGRPSEVDKLKVGLKGIKVGLAGRNLVSFRSSRVYFLLFKNMLVFDLSISKPTKSQLTKILNYKLLVQKIFNKFDFLKRDPSKNYIININHQSSKTILT